MYNAISYHSDYSTTLENIEEVKGFIKNQLEHIREQDSEVDENFESYIAELNDIKDIQDAEEYSDLIAYHFETVGETGILTVSQITKIHYVYKMLGELYDKANISLDITGTIFTDMINRDRHILDNEAEKIVDAIVQKL